MCHLQLDFPTPKTNFVAPAPYIMSIRLRLPDKIPHDQTAILQTPGVTRSTYINTYLSDSFTLWQKKSPGKI